MVTLVSALDWGLGHATRIIPIIVNLIDKGDEVIIGASKKQEAIYHEFFPTIKIVNLPSMSPVYSRRSSQVFSLMLFLPQFLFSIYKEHTALKKLIKLYGIEKVVSDNRYGLYNSSVYSIFITHQLNILLPTNIKIFQAVVNRINCRVINQYNECWVPDFTPDKNISGVLSIPRFKLSTPLVYKGLLSRFSLVEAEHVNRIPKLLILISGPEKQRTVFENLIIGALRKYAKPIDYLIVRGLPLEKECTLPYAINHCSAGRLKTYIQKSKYIICRSGYSTVMDLAYLGKKALLIPTPGQTEQEYLANYLSSKQKFLTTSQDNIDIKEIISHL